MRNLIFYIAVFAVGCVGGADRKELVLTDNWELKGSVKRLFQTPIGYVYQFEPSPDYHFPVPPARPHPPNCNCKFCKPPNMEGMLQYSFLKSNKVNKRFVVLDFHIRAYPAFESGKYGDFRFALIRSSLSDMSDNYKDLNGLFDETLFTTPRNGTLSLVWINRKYPQIRPNFEPMAVRFIFDTKQEKIIVENNGFQRIYKNETKERIIPPVIRSIGLITMAGSDKYRRRYLEISLPTIRQYDNQNEVDALKPLLFSTYPYESYQYAEDKKRRDGSFDTLVKNAFKSKNPDFQYAIALKLLYGGPEQCNPPKALELLGEAAKKDHVLAFYQLGICYFRGYGTIPDFKKSLRYMEKALDHEYDNAAALQWFIRWDDAKRPIFATEEFIKNYEKHIIFNSWNYNLFHICQLLNTSGDSFFFMPVAKSFMMNRNALLFWVNQDSRAKQYRFVDYAIASGYYPAYAAKAMQTAELVRLSDGRFLMADLIGKPNAATRKIQLLQTGIAAGDNSAVPELLRELARNQKLELKEFTQERDMAFAENALYQFLAFGMKNPEAPGMVEYCREGYLAAEKVLRQSDRLEAKYMLGLLKLIDKEVPKMFMCAIQEHMVDVKEGFQFLQEAAEGGIVEAEYLLGYYLWKKDLPAMWNKFNAQKLLESAMNKGHQKAAFILANIEFENNNLAKALVCLKASYATGYPPAFYLQGNILRKMGRHGEAKQAYIEAIKAGKYQGLRELALYSPGLRKTTTDSNLWYNFIQADLRYRKFDAVDPYYPNPYAELYKWKRITMADEMDEAVFVRTRNTEGKPLSELYESYESYKKHSKSSQQPEGYDPRLEKRNQNPKKEKGRNGYRK